MLKFDSILLLSGWLALAIPAESLQVKQISTRIWGINSALRENFQLQVGLQDSSFSRPLSTDDPSSVQVKEIEGPFAPLPQLVDCWGRSPVLIRNAYDPTEMNRLAWPSWQEMITLACPDLENYDDENDKDSIQERASGESARLIQHIPGKLDSYTLELGPFDREVFDEIDPNYKWTLLVNDVDRYKPALSDWIDDDFDFLPRWRRDDAQISIAPTGGGIGPHVDNYDVFLIQTTGSRSWRVGTRTMTSQEEFDALIPDLSVRILGHDFESKEYTLNSGDMLYLPPRVVHCGTSLSDDCITLSVGCRAPSADELVALVAESLLDQGLKRYTDPHLIQDCIAASTPSSPLLSSATGTRDDFAPSVSREVKDSLKDLVLRAVQQVLDTDEAWDEIVGRVLTEPKRFLDSALVPYGDLQDRDYISMWGRRPADVVQKVKKGQGSFFRAEGISFATTTVHKLEESEVDRLFCFGDMWEAPHNEATARVFHHIAFGHAVRGELLQDADDMLLSVLEDLVAEGLIYASDEVEE